MPEQRIRAKPKATVGHHFSALLQCTHRAWCDYFIDPKLKSPPPSFLRALQAEGNAHEQEICRRLYPSAINIPDRIHPDERRHRTLAAMRSGSSAILQAYFAEDDGVGVADVLELHGPSTDSSTGFVYKVGEFKRASKLQTAHVLQAAWYTELLGRVQGTSLNEVFFILGDGSRHVVMLTEVAEVYEQCKAELMRLRHPHARPGPHLCRSCLSCPWRGVCMPELVESQHISLVPDIGRTQADTLRSLGVSRWPQLTDATTEQLQLCQFEAHQLRQIRQSHARLLADQAVTRFPIRSSRLAELAPVSVEFSATAQHGEFPLPSALWYEDVTAPARIQIDASGHADLSTIAHRSTIAVYGAREMAVVQRLLRENGHPATKCVDLLELIENFVHAPMLGLELAQVVKFVKPASPAPSSSSERVLAMRTILDWMSIDGRAAA